MTNHTNSTVKKSKRKSDTDSHVHSPVSAHSQVNDERSSDDVIVIDDDNDIWDDGNDDSMTAIESVESSQRKVASKQKQSNKNKSK